MGADMGPRHGEPNGRRANVITLVKKSAQMTGLTHSSQHQVFKEGQVATSQLKEFAETGRSDSLDAVTYERQGSKVLDAFYAPAIREGVGETQAKFFADGNHSMVSMVAKIVPSPDWFVGVNSLQLCVAGHWLNATSLELSPLDAGTDQGLAFTSPSWQLTPADVVKRITNTSPSHPASSFAYPEKTSLPTMASVSIVKIREYRLVKPSTTTVPLRVIETTTTRTTEPTTTVFTTASPATLHEIDHNYILPSLHTGNSVRPIAQKQRQISSPTPRRRQKSVDGGTVGAEVRNVVHSISNSGETLPEITTNISHAIRSQEVPSRDPPYVAANGSGRHSTEGTSVQNEIHVSDDTKSSREESTESSGSLSNTPQNQHLSDDSNLISNDVAVLTNSVDEEELRETNVHPGRDVPLSAVLPRDQYDRLQQERHRQAIEHHEKLQQLLQEKRRKLKEKKRKHRERKLAATRTDRREQNREAEEPGLNRHRLLKVMQCPSLTTSSRRTSVTNVVNVDCNVAWNVEGDANSTDSTESHLVAASRPWTVRSGSGRAGQHAARPVASESRSAPGRSSNTPVEEETGAPLSQRPPGVALLETVTETTSNGEN
ncbi:Spondin N-terminal [Trinorchestia longiramus]|nr:Spondin N-terminal [Trinorchestia longiramus]